MARKIVLSIILLVVVFWPLYKPGPVFAETTQASCLDESNITFGEVFDYLGDIIISGVPLFSANLLTSLMADPPKLGFSVLGFGINVDIGGALEPFDEISDFLWNKWLWAVFLGIAGTFGAIATGHLIDFAINLNHSLTVQGGANPFLEKGYGTMLSLVNLGFVIAIIIIAFATMFRRSGWDMRSSLAKLVIAALLINFSLFIGLGISSIGTTITQTIINSVPCPGTTLAGTFNIINMHSATKKFLETSLKEPVTEDEFLDEAKEIKLKNLLTKAKEENIITSFVKNIFKKFIISTVSIFFSSALVIIGALTMLGIFLFLIARYVAVSVLLIFMPIAWLGLVFPKLQIPGLGNVWSGWWKQYMKWILCGPIIAFFLYLTVELITYLKSPEALDSIQGSGLFGGIAQMFIVIVFSLSGLYAANKLGAAGASMIYGGMTGVWTRGLSQLKGAAKIDTSKIGLKAYPKSEKAQKFFRKLSLTPGLKTVGRAGLAATSAAAAAFEATGTDFVKKYKDLPADSLNDIVKGLNPKDPRYAALMKYLMEKDLLRDPKSHLAPNIKASLNRAGKGKIYEDIVNAAVGTIESFQDMANGNIDDAAEKLKIVFDKVKLDKNFGKNVGIAGVFEGNDATHQEATVKASIMASPEFITATIKSIKPKDKAKFIDMFAKAYSEYSAQGKVDVRVEKFSKTPGFQKLFK